MLLIYNSQKGNHKYRDGLSDNSSSDTTNSLNLNEHKAKIKTEKIYKCSLCDMRFDRKSALSKHALSHRGCQSYECSKCHKKFSSLSDYLFHSNTKHQNM